MNGYRQEDVERIIERLEEIHLEIYRISVTLKSNRMTYMGFLLSVIALIVAVLH